MGFRMISDCRISGRYIGKRERGSYSTKPFVLEAKTAKINNEKYEKINKQVRKIRVQFWGWINPIELVPRCFIGILFENFHFN